MNGIAWYGDQRAASELGMSTADLVEVQKHGVTSAMIRRIAKEPKPPKKKYHAPRKISMSPTRLRTAGR